MQLDWLLFQLMVFMSINLVILVLMMVQLLEVILILTVLHTVAILMDTQEILFFLFIFLYFWFFLSWPYYIILKDKWSCRFQWNYSFDNHSNKYLFICWCNELYSWKSCYNSSIRRWLHRFCRFLFYSFFSYSALHLVSLILF